MINSRFSAVALINFPLVPSEADEENFEKKNIRNQWRIQTFTTETKSTNPNPSIIVLAACIAVAILFEIDIEPEVSITSTTFFGPEAAAIYQGLNLGS